MKKAFLTIPFFLLLFTNALAQNTDNNAKIFKKKVLSDTEIDWVTGVYMQDGDHASVTGGIGNEELKNFANNITIAIPVKNNDVLTVDWTISAYTSASSGNLNPFSGASRGDDDDDDDNDDRADNYSQTPVTGSPWVAGTGASRKDVWINANLGYSHTSDDRNTVYSGTIGFANEFDYTSFSGSFHYTRLFNSQNTEISLGAKIYLDTWRPQYPTEIKTYYRYNGDLNAGFFNNVPILDKTGNPIDKNSNYRWQPSPKGLIDNKARNSYTFSIGFSQILSKRLQMSLSTDITLQEGWLANPMQRVYFADKDNFYIGNPGDIPYYTDKNINKGVFQLADDIERLPGSRLKIPLGIRLHYYLNEYVVFRTYYRYYFDDWGIRSNTFNLEIPVKISDKFTLYPSYRFYNQTAADYFYPYEQALSTMTYYTSDYDLSAFTAQQVGMGIRYTDIFTQKHLWKFGLKTVSLSYHYYFRNSEFRAGIVSLGVKMVK